MSEYVKWFCEELLGIGYESKDLLSIWMTMKKDISNTQISSVVYNVTKDHQQLTIFDV